MYLSADSVVHYLMQRGVLSACDVVRDEWFVVQSDSTRPVLRVSTLDGRGWIVKQASPLDPTRVRLLDREAAFLELAEVDPWARRLRRWLPRLRAYDPGVHALVVQQLAYDTGWDHLRRASSQAETLGRLLGHAFAAIHMPIERTRVPTVLLAPQLPWILQLERTDAAEAEQASMRELLTLVRSEPRLGQALAELAGQWRIETLIHGDAKLDNVLVRMPGPPRVWLIDWAFAGEGDPAWDVGSLVRSAMLLWIFGITFTRDVPFQEAAQGSVFPLALVRTFVTRFVSAYLDARSLRGPAAARFVRRAFRYAGAALVQSALADARSRERFTLRQLAMLQLSVGLIETPDAASREFLEGRPGYSTPTPR